ncbi:response regulator [Myxococcota bacterium]|nr:response regulator [Myxococcota bacterium]
MRAILTRLLKELGFETLEALHGKDAYDRLPTMGPVDVALVDWNMPEMTGFEFVQAIRQKHEFDEMRIVMVTTESNLGNMAQALEAGANEYVMKPFTTDALRSKLELIGVVS